MNELSMSARMNIGSDGLPPFKVKSVEPIYTNTREYRLKRIKKMGNNPFLLPAQDIIIDFLTDSGTSAMSDRQWAGIMGGR